VKGRADPVKIVGGPYWRLKDTTAHTEQIYFVRRLSSQERSLKTVEVLATRADDLREILFRIDPPPVIDLKRQMELLSEVLARSRAASILSKFHRHAETCKPGPRSSA